MLFCQDFVSIKKEGRKEKGQGFRSLEVRRKLIALKKCGFEFQIEDDY